ncbi:MAG: hypothetical protein JWL98_1662, partial [Xanthomonadaceae bacterium]|nr:hypothetical protein [Xanthomonadaceae bacterium]
MSEAAIRHYRFESYHLDTQTRELRDGGGTVLPLTAKAFDTLCFLIEHRGRVVGKDELLASVWAGRVVEENNLTQAIAALRRALGTSAGEHRYVVTLPGRGYQFVAEVQEGEADIVAEPRQVVAPTPRAPGGPKWRQAITFGSLLFMLALFAVAAWQLRESTSSRHAPQQVSLAVLPFRSLSSGPRDRMLELGMAETLIARLSRSTSMRVLSLGSVQAFTDAPRVDPLQVGMTLGANYVVEGSTQQRGDLIRVNAHLLSLPDGRTLWAGTYDQTPERVFTLQDVLAAEVSSALSFKYAATTPRHSPCDGSDPIAYRAYLRGRYLINRPNALRLPTAIAAFREAIDRDPSCARAWAGTAFAYRALVMTGDADPRAVFPLAKTAVEKALAIDPNSAEAYASKGFIEFWYDWDWARAEASLRRALALDGNLAEAHLALSHLLINTGRIEEAAPQARQAAQLDPLSPIANTLAAGIVDEAGYFDEARQRLKSVLELEPDFWIALLVRGGMATGARDYPHAISDLRKASEVCGHCSQALVGLGQAYVLS